MIPPVDCVNPRLWIQANDLAQRHVANNNGFCVLCGTSTPCRIREAARDAMQRAMAPDPVIDVVDPEPPPDPQPMAQSRPPAPVGARFRHLREEELAEPAAEPTTEVAPGLPESAEAEAPVGARFRRESRIGRRRRND